MINPLSAPAAIAANLGERLKQTRLNANLTQTEVAARAGVSRKLVIAAEKGQTQLETLIAIMQALDLIAQLDLFLPQPTVSPLQLAKLQGKKRQRASAHAASKIQEDPEW